MRKVVATGVAVLVTCGAVMACSATDSDPGDPGKATPVAIPQSTDSANVYFEGNVDPSRGTFEIVYRTSAGEIVKELPSLGGEPGGERIPEALGDGGKNDGGDAGGGGVDAGSCTSNLQNPLLYTTNLSATAGVFLHTVNSQWVSPNLSGGVCPMNLWQNPVCNYTAWIDGITITSPQAGQSVGVLDNPPGGGNTTAWTCLLGDGGGTPGVPPCHFSFGNVAHTSSFCAGPHPFVFHESGPGSAAGFAFTFHGHVSGDQPTH